MSIPTLDALRASGAAQQPQWPDAGARDAVVDRLRRQPPLVFAGECDLLRERLAAVARGEAFLLQGGDCAETFDGVGADDVRNKLQVLLSMAVVLTYAASVPVVKVGRIAGQYAKPRSSDSETRDGVTLPAYRGDAVNGHAFTPESRTPDPARLLEVYHASAATLNLTRAFVTGGYADLRQVHTWNTDFVRTSPVGKRYERLGAEIDRALAFMAACGQDMDEFHSVEFYSSHEALLLEYEHAMTRIDSRTQAPYDVSGHFVWVGERTRQLDGAHVELLSRVRNPIGVKLGPTVTADTAIALAERLDPDREPGRLTFVARMGAGRVRDLLPDLIAKVQAAGVTAAWVCDPMHGNTYETANGYKTRDFESVIDEVQGFFEVHRALGTWPGGLHVELTGDDVTECLGGGAALAAGDLVNRYETLCDPRLNRAQSLELAFLVAEMLRQR
ncbi:MAG: 3-deoxy-7-phosphoheptulonate synthase class II [Nocardioidaceae bacterium]|nr:3-deoxy-7-phosphoheptulonate synthase class II [Nocardioidaceae bacterium]MDQ3324161.1 3-deoxy-7-phosphoheptulonate synthase class II [Actinomycetota bacterium]